MPELQSCYFCGTPDDVQEYAVIPPRFAPDEADQRSVVLCPQCKDKLLRVVEPLADRLDEAVATAPETGASPPTDEAAAADTEKPTAADTAAGTEDTPTVGTGDTATDMYEDGVTIDAGGGAAAGDEPEPEPTLRVPEDDASESEDGGEDEDRGEKSSTASQPPANYRKAMRLLSNREFPMDRYDVEGLLAGAYDMENEEVDAVLDYALERGRLVDENGTLREP